MGKSLPEYSLEEILSVIAGSILSNPNACNDGDYELLNAVSNRYYVLKEE